MDAWMSVAALFIIANTYKNRFFEYIYFIDYLL